MKSRVAWVGDRDTIHTGLGKVGYSGVNALGIRHAGVGFEPLEFLEPLGVGWNDCEPPSRAYCEG
jgi:hypothetical protein